MPKLIELGNERTWIDPHLIFRVEVIAMTSVAVFYGENVTASQRVDIPCATADAAKVLAAEIVAKVNGPTMGAQPNHDDEELERLTAPMPSRVPGVWGNQAESPAKE